MTSRIEPVAIASGDVVAIAGWASAQGIDLVVVGPEAPLAAGLVDRLERSGVPAFGPTKAAAQIESSKSYADALMQRAGVPSANSASFVDHAEASAYVREHGAPIVVKASGLAAGKGVIVCETVCASSDRMVSSSNTDPRNQTRTSIRETCSYMFRVTTCTR